MNEGEGITPRSFLITLAVAIAVMLGLFLVDTFLARMERTESQLQAVRLFEEGTRLSSLGQYREAADRLRAALANARDNREYQLALAQTLLEAGAMPEAERNLLALLQNAANNGPANLAMARLLTREGKANDAVSYYHRAIYGQWKGDTSKSLVQARFELTDLLATQNAQKELLAELLVLQDEVSKDPLTAKRIARLYLVAGSPVRAAPLFREILRANPEDGDARAGLGEADFAAGNYRSAQAHFLAALHASSDSTAIKQRLELCTEVLALDPQQRGLSTRARYLRSVKLIELALERLNQCVPASNSQAGSELVEESHRLLDHRAGFVSSEAVDKNLDLAERLWQTRRRQCPEASRQNEEPLELVMARVFQR